MNDGLIIDGIECELAPNSRISVTKQINNIADMSDRQTSYTGRLRLPLTNQNKLATGQTQQVNSAEDKAYNEIRGTAYAGGVPVEKNGFVQILGVGRNIELSIAGPEYGFFKKLESLDLLNDIDWTDLDHTWDNTGIEDSFPNTTGYIYPMVQTGQLNDTNISVLSKYTHPAIYLKTVIDRIATATGYTFSGEVLTNDLYLISAFPFSTGDFLHSDRYIEERSFSFSASQKLTYSDVATSNQTGRIISVIAFGSENRFTSTRTMTIGQVGINLNVTDLQKTLPSGATATVKVGIRKNGTTIVGTPTTINQIDQYLEIETNVSVVPTDYLEAVLIMDVNIGSGPFVSVSVEIESASFYTPEIDRAIVFGDTVTAESYLPDMSAKELIRGFMYTFGLVPVVDDFENTVEFKYFDELENNKGKALDWSDKLVKPKNSNHGQWYENKATKIGSYGQTNYLKYKNDNTLDNKQVGQGEVIIADGTLPVKNDIFTLPWAACDTIEWVSNTERLVKIPLYVGDPFTGELDRSSKDPQQKIIYVVRRDKAVSLNDGTNVDLVSTGVPYGKFIDPAEPNNLGFNNNLQAKHYSTFINTLQDAQKLDCLFNLSPADVGNIDHFTPVWIDKFSAFYYVNKIKNYVRGKVSKVELIKI